TAVGGKHCRPRIRFSLFHSHREIIFGDTQLRASLPLGGGTRRPPSSRRLPLKAAPGRAAGLQAALERPRGCCAPSSGPDKLARTGEEDPSLLFAFAPVDGLGANPCRQEEFGRKSLICRQGQASPAITTVASTVSAAPNVRSAVR